MEKTLYDLKDGDYVLCVGTWTETIRKIERQTPHYLIVNGIRYRKKDGRNTQAFLDRVEVLTYEKKEKMLKRHIHLKLAREVKMIDWDALTDEQLKTIINIAKNQKIDCTK